MQAVQPAQVRQVRARKMMDNEWVIGIVTVMVATIFMRLIDRGWNSVTKKHRINKFRRKLEQIRRRFFSVYTDDKWDSYKEKYFHKLYEEWDKEARNFLEYDARFCLSEKEYDDFKTSNWTMRGTSQAGNYRFMTKSLLKGHFEYYEKYEWLEMRPYGQS